MSDALLKADLAALEGAHRKLEGSIGTQRLRAAEKAFVARRSSSTPATLASVAAPSPTAVTSDDEPTATLALARAAGIGRFGSMEGS